MRAALLAFVVVLGGCGSCGVDSGSGPPPKKIDPAYINEHLPKQLPEGLERVDATFGDGLVTLAGSTLDHDVLAPGGALRLTVYWVVKKPIGPGWRVFARIKGQPNTADFMNLAVTDMELAHGPETWRTGEIVADQFDVQLRADWRSQTATVEVGLVKVGEHGLGDRMPTSGPHVVDRAVLVRTMRVDLSKAPPPPGTIYISKARGAITVDGNGNDPGWVGAVTSPEFVTAESSPEPVGKATAKMTWDDDNLYLFVQVTDTDIVSPYTKHDDSLWKADDVEIFIDADGNRRGYVELQVNPNNATFDSWFAGTRASPPGDPKWDSQMRTAVKLRGTSTSEPGDTDVGWDAEMAIPWEAVKGRDDKMKVHLPPQVGDRWRLNVVRVDVHTGDDKVSATSWNRITYSDFHALDRMLTAVFADDKGAITAGTKDEGSGDGSGTGSGSGNGSGSGSGTSSGSNSPARP